MRILVSNDDGVHAEGIRALSEALRACGEVVVVAPDRNRSGASHSLTLEVPLRVTRLDASSFHGIKSYAVKGTPTDCVHLAVNELLRPEPDMVVAGINHGANLGMTSSTRGRWRPRRKGVILVSLHRRIAGGQDPFRQCGPLRRPAGAGADGASVACGSDPQRECAGPAARADQGDQGDASWQSPPGESVIRTEDPRGQPVYWIGPRQPAGCGRGNGLCRHRAGLCLHHSLTIDMTAYGSLSTLGAWLDLQG